MLVALAGTALYFAFKSRGAAHRAETAIFGVLALFLAVVAAILLAQRLARRTISGRWPFPVAFSITAEGALCLLVIFLLALVALNTGNNLLFLILAISLSAIIVSGIVARTSLKDISLSLQVPENVFVGERVWIKVSMKNMKRIFPSFSIRVEDLELSRSSSLLSPIRKLALRKRKGKSQQYRALSRSILPQPAYFPVLRPGEMRSQLVAQCFFKRGPYRLEGFWVSTRFPFGFIRRGERIEAHGEVLVYPSLREVSSFFHLLPFLPGSMEGKRVGPGESLFSIRKYYEGESARMVDWKATAKTGELMAREFARPEENVFCLILDTLIHPPPRRGFTEEFEKAVSFAASLVVHFAREGSELEFLTPYEHIERGAGQDHINSILRSLAIVQCKAASRDESADLRMELSGILEVQTLRRILSDKVFKIIITSKPRGSFPSSIWRSSHTICFDEL